MFSNIKDVFEWLDKDNKGAPYYLNLLNLYWGGKGEDAVINKFKKLALKLKHHPNLIKELIRDSNWRSTLIGNAVAILLRKRNFQSDLIWRLENWNWAAPQIAVGIALLDEGSAEKQLRRIIENARSDIIYQSNISSKLFQVKFSHEGSTQAIQEVD